MTCDYHTCAQCADPEPNVDFGIWIHSTTRGLRITADDRALPNVDLPASYARRLAKQLLDAADQVEDRTWAQRDTPAEGHIP